MLWNMARLPKIIHSWLASPDVIGFYACVEESFHSVVQFYG